jgi:GNAT superfamily N-acetyltransferase
MIEIKKLDIKTWDGFVSLMEADIQCSECWCLNHRATQGCSTGLLAKNEMKTLTADGKVHGLLAYDEEKCIGWVAIDPMSEMIGHDLQSTGKDTEWTIHCLFIAEKYRSRGISTLLIQAATEYARSNGAKVVSAFPIPQDNRKKFPENEAEFSGRFSTYHKLGFRTDGDASDFYQRVVIE